MAHFIAMIHGNRGPASRLGTEKSGISASAQGWNSGVSIRGWHQDNGDQDIFEVHATTGSNGGGHDRFLGSVLRAADGHITFVAAQIPEEHNNEPA